MEITEAQLRAIHEAVTLRGAGPITPAGLEAVLGEVLGATVTRPDPLLPKAREIAAGVLLKAGYAAEYCEKVRSGATESESALSALAALRHADAVVREVRNIVNYDANSCRHELVSRGDILAKLGAAS